MVNGTKSIAVKFADIFDKLPKTDPSQVQTNVVNVLLWAAGIIAVAMIIVGGVQMTTSAGNPTAVGKAKKTITYSVIGLVVVLVAYALVNFVFGKVSGTE